MLNYLQQPCFNRLFTLAKKKVRSLSGLRGVVVLDNLSPQEQDLIGGFLGKNCLGKTKVSIPLAELDQVLQNSPLELGLLPFLESYFKEKLITRREEIAAWEQDWSLFFDQLQKIAQTEVTKNWLNKLFTETGSGYRTLLALFQQNPETAQEEITICIKALDYLANHRGHKIRIPVFAASLTGDPHAFDLENSLGRLFYYSLIHYLAKPELDYSAEGKRSLFREAGLLDDDVSSSVLVAGLQVCPEDPRNAIFHGANNSSSPLVLPLRFLESPTLWQSGQRIYVVENPAVFSTILDHSVEASLPPIICGSGQPSVAALTLLDQLANAGCVLYYSGDFDLKGLEIALRLWQRYKQNFRAWSYDTATYLSVPKGKGMDASQRNNLSKLHVPWDKQLVHEMLRRNLFVYQESFLDKLISSVGRR